MASENPESALKDQNFVSSLILESSTTAGRIVRAKGDQTTGRLLVDSTGGGGTPALPFNSVQFNNAGAFGGSADFTFTFDGDSNPLITLGHENLEGRIKAPDATTVDTQGSNFDLSAGNGNGVASGGGFSFGAGNAGTDGNGGSFDMSGGNAFGTGHAGGGFGFSSGNAVNNNGGVFSLGGGDDDDNNGGPVNIVAGSSLVDGNGGSITQTAGNGAGSGSAGVVQINGGQGGATDGPGGDIDIFAGSASGGNGLGGGLIGSGGGGSGSGDGGDLLFTGGPGGDTGNGGGAILVGGAGGNVSGLGGSVQLIPGVATSSTDNGHVVIQDPTTTNFAILDTSLLVTVATDRTYKFPDASGTFLLDTDAQLPVYHATDGDPGTDISITSGDALTTGEGGSFEIRTGIATGGNFAGGVFQLVTGSGSGTQPGGDVLLQAGNGGITGRGGSYNITAGDGGATSGDGGTINIIGGNGIGGSSNGGNLILGAGDKSGAGTEGTIQFADPSSGMSAIFDTSLLASSNRTLTIQNASGTIAYLSDIGTPTSFVTNEIVSGSGTSFTLANTPVAGSVAVYGGGGRLKLGTDYSISGTTITVLIGSYSSGDIISDYRK